MRAVPRGVLVFGTRKNPECVVHVSRVYKRGGVGVGWLAGWVVVVVVVVGRWGGWVGRVGGVEWVGDPTARSGGCTAQTRSECTQRTFALFTDAHCGPIQPALATMLHSAPERADTIV